MQRTTPDFERKGVPEMRFNPHEYQTNAIQFLAENNRGALLLDMGLG